MSSRSNTIISVVIVALIFSTVGGYVFLTNQYVPPQIAVVVLEPGFGDRSLADQVLEGLEELAGDSVVNYTYRVAADESNGQEVLQQLASSGRYDLIIALGDRMTAPLQAVSSQYTNQRFAFIGGSVNADNVASATFALHQAAFIAGALAGFIATANETRSGVIGIIGSTSGDAAVIQMIAGFTQGLAEANTTYNLNVTLLPTQYVGSYNDSSTAYLRAVSMFNPAIGNATVIFAPVRASIMGIRTAMEYANETWFSDVPAREPFVIAAEGNQDYLGLENIDIRAGDDSWVVTSVVPRSDTAVYRMINSTLWDRFQGGTTNHYNLSNGGVNITDFEFSSRWITPEMSAALQGYYAAIFTGVIVVDDGLP